MTPGTCTLQPGQSDNQHTQDNHCYHTFYVVRRKLNISLAKWRFCYALIDAENDDTLEVLSIYEMCVVGKASDQMSKLKRSYKQATVTEIVSLQTWIKLLQDSTLSLLDVAAQYHGKYYVVIIHTTILN